MVAPTANPGVKANGIPIVAIAGDIIAQYNKADAQVKAGKQLMEDLRPELVEVGTSEIYARSCQDPTHPSLTVKLQDDVGEELQVQFVKKYGALVDVERAEEFFEDSEVDINDYVQERIVAKFDSDIFLDADGVFQQRVYDAFRKAIETVAKQLDVPCPLETAKVVTPKDAFHVERWKHFNAQAQATLADLVPNVIRIVPVTVNKVS